ncbi:hypothetical protein [Corynebacterium meridianum]|uniref:hypothetical protein n=1 Tax=Corynebacterium meridianum TaxID=2765363 RepID=UPI001E37A72D|nr:hypothetical protein [Corynebacterium meridianum]
MPRRNHSRRGHRAGRSNPQAPRSLPRDGAVYYGTQEMPGPSYTGGAPHLVRRIGSSRASKFYVCPGCNQNIPPGVAHIVAWPRNFGRGADDRRHWHRHCWERR